MFIFHGQLKLGAADQASKRQSTTRGGWLSTACQREAGIFVPFIESFIQLDRKPVDAIDGRNEIKTE